MLLLKFPRTNPIYKLLSTWFLYTLLGNTLQILYIVVSDTAAWDTRKNQPTRDRLLQQVDRCPSRG